MTELDYSAPTRSNFNSDYILHRLPSERYADQELVWFMVEGCQLKAALAPQLLLLRHLLSIQGLVREVKRDVLSLSEHGRNEIFDNLSLLPARFNGKGVVWKANGKLRPIDYACDLCADYVVDNCGLRV